MTAGVPGTGLGGLFYILAALLLPLRGIYRKLRRRRMTWRGTAKLTGLALGVLIGIWVTGWLLGWLLGPLAVAAESAAGLAITARAKAHNLVRWATLLGGFVTLVFVLLSVQMARIVNRRR